jgi:septal ring factor EnvC (AmiA/AmiB activator)
MQDDAAPSLMNLVYMAAGLLIKDLIPGVPKAFAWIASWFRTKDQRDYDGLNQLIEYLKTDNASLRGEIAELRKQLGEVQRAVGQNTQKVDQVKADIGPIKDAAETLKHIVEENTH